MSERVLSNQACVLWAKSDPTGGDGWMPLYRHMADSAATARLLWRDWLPESFRNQVIDHCGDEISAEALVVWLAGGHDLGKAAPAFQFKVSTLAARVHELGLFVPNQIAYPPYHALLSQGILRRWLMEHGWNSSTAQTYAIIAGGHHGAPPKQGEFEKTILYPAIKSDGLGEGEWTSVQNELADYVAELSKIETYLGAWSRKPLSPQLQVLLTGVVIMADWIASNAELFPFQDVLSSGKRAARAWQQLGLPSAWQPPQVIDEDNSTFFHNRFEGLPADVVLRPAQTIALEAARAVSTPGIMIVEAPMGMGKTEIGLLAAEVMASKFGCGGVSFLLPTMATSDAMFTRVFDWLNQVPDRRGLQSQTMSLAHGKAALNPYYRKLFRWGYSSMGDDNKKEVPPEAVLAHQWLNGRKRTLLSSFVVGTVDQLLMGALKAKHVALRHLGLAGKVIVVDEVHAYDTYMSVYLERILEWLGAYQVPVILLSATLPPERRAAFLKAYRTTFVKPSENHVENFPIAPRQANGNPSYPLITTCEPSAGATNGTSGIRYHACESDNRGNEVILERIADDDSSLVALVKSGLVEGGCIGIIRNTVDRAQHIFEVLTEQLDVEIRLTHSRFISIDRATNDRELVRLLGPDSSERPQALVVVGTQVLEQSLDIDFDLMITDIAPVDLLLQRMGRLHRHQRGENEQERPPPLRRAKCVISGVTDWDSMPPAVDRGITSVYSPSLLLRTLCQLRSLVSDGEYSINLPGDIAPLVETVYSDSYCAPDLWADAIRIADERHVEERKVQALKASAYLLGPVRKMGRDITGWIDVEVKNADDDNARGQAAVRDTEESIEAIVVQRIDDQIRLLPWVQKMSVAAGIVSTMDFEDENGKMIETSTPPDDATAHLAATCSVRLPPVMSKPWSVDRVICALEQTGAFEGWQQSRWLKGQLPLVLDADFNTQVAEFSLHYGRETGLQLLRKEEL